MKEFLLIGWGVVATLGTLVFYAKYRLMLTDVRCANDLREQVITQLWNEREEAARHARQQSERIWTLEDENCALKRPAPSTASVKD